MQARKKLRSHYLKLRSQLADQTCVEHGYSIAQYLLNSSLFQESKKISFYMAVNGEVPLEFLLNTSLTLQKDCYLPCMSSLEQTLEFRKFSLHDRLEKNKFGILEPLPTSPSIAPEQLDIVLTPLVAWDKLGHRLGMGAGFYDRTFAFKTTTTSKPWLIGIAHQCQQHPALVNMPWDVNLDALVTEIGFYDF